MTGATMTGVSAVGLAGTAPAAPPAGWAFRTDGTFRVLVGPTTVIDTDQFNQNVHWGAMDLSGIDLNHASFVNNTFNNTIGSNVWNKIATNLQFNRGESYTVRCAFPLPDDVVIGKLQNFFMDPIVMAFCVAVLPTGVNLEGYCSEVDDSPLPNIIHVLSP